MIKQFLGSIYLKLKLFYIFKPLFRNKLTVLTYHNPNEHEFEQQLIFLKKHYSIISEKEVIAFFEKKKPLPDYPLLITFDDGYKNIETFVSPLLKKHDMKALVFLPTNYIGTSKVAWWDISQYYIDHAQQKKIVIDNISFDFTKKYMRKKFYNFIVNLGPRDRDRVVQELKNKTKSAQPKKIPDSYKFISWKILDSLSCEYASHTHNHPILTRIDTKTLIDEFTASKIILKKKIGYCNTICYPNGFYDSAVANEARKHYKAGFSSDWGCNDQSTDPFKIKRIGIDKHDNVGVLAAKITGMFHLLYWFRNRPLKVIHATNYYFPQLGGITIALSRVQKELESHDIDSEVIAFSPLFRTIEKKIGAMGKHAHRVFTLLFIAQIVMRTIWYKFQLRPVIVHGHSAAYCGLAAYVSSFFGAKSVFSFQTDLRLHGYTFNENITHKKWKFFDHIDVLHAVSPFLANQAQSYYQIDKKIEVVHQICPKVKITKKHKANTILYVGNLIDIKGPLLFLEAIAMVAKKRRISVTMIGDGVMRAQVKDVIANNHLNNIVTHHYRVPSEKMNSMYQQHWVYVCSSLGEGLPNTVFEALANRCRVVSTAVGIVPHLHLEKNKAGSMIPTNNAAAMARAILKELDLPIKNNDALLEQFSSEHVDREYLQTYTGLLL